MAYKNPGFTEFGAPVPDEEYLKFRTAFPQHGAVKWFINQALINFNEVVEENPQAQELVTEAIERMATLTRALVAARANSSGGESATT